MGKLRIVDRTLYIFRNIMVNYSAKFRSLKFVMYNRYTFFIVNFFYLLPDPSNKYLKVFLVKKRLKTYIIHACSLNTS